MDNDIKKLVDSLPTLTGETYAYVLTALLKNIGALPLQNTISFDVEGTLLINGNQLQLEQAIAFKEGCHSLKDNWARKVINDQLKFLAVELGIHKALTPERMNFAKAALWIIDQENTLIESVLN